MIKLISRYAVVLMGFLVNIAFANPLVIDDGVVLNHLPIAGQIQTYTGDLLPDSALAASRLPDSAYVAVGAASPLRLMQTQWFRFSVRNDSSVPRSLVLDFDQALYSRIEWRASTGSTIKEFVTGQSYPYASRDLHYNYFAFNLEIPPGQILTVNFSIYTPYGALFVPVLSDSEEFTRDLPSLWQFSGSVFGMLYSVALCLLVYIVRIPRLGVATALLGQVVFSMLSVLYLTGVVQRWFPDTGIPWRDIAYVVIHCGQGVCYTLAVISFFQSPVNYPYLNKILTALLLAGLLCVVLLPWVNLDYLIVATLVVTFWMMIFSTVLAVISLFRRQQGTALFAGGLVVFVVLASIAMLGVAGVLPPSFMTRYSYELGLTVQADVLFLAIAMRMFTIEREQAAMQEEMLRMDTEMKVRNEFVDRVTHDIKSPLSAVLGAEQLLRNTRDDAKRDSYLDVIRASCGMVINIVDNILNHSRIRSGQVVLNQQSFSLRAMLDEMEAAIKVIPQPRPVAFSMTVDQKIPALVCGDKVRVSQVITNLVANAFKFTDEGRISITVDLFEKTENKIMVRFVIQDTGIGMSEEFLKKAFEPYAREEHSGTYRQGFGLGLSICKQIVSLLGGSIDVLSAVGQGSRFIVLLPFTVP